MALKSTPVSRNLKKLIALDESFRLYRDRQIPTELKLFRGRFSFSEPTILRSQLFNPDLKLCISKSPQRLIA